MSEQIERIIPDDINPVDYYNMTCVQHCFEMMLSMQNVFKVGIDAFAVKVNIGDELKRMVVIENDYFVVKMKNGLTLDVGAVYSPFMLLQKYKFRGSFSHAISYIQYDLMKKPVPFVRIGTKHFKIINKIDRYDVVRSELALWDKMTIAEDHPKSIFDKIEKYDDFTIVPDNKSHSPIVGNNYNLYSPFEHNPCKDEEYDELKWYWIRTLIEHVFGDQYELGITYIKTLYDLPKQPLPILVLVSEERSTGKTTFIDFLNILFGANAVIINPQDISNQFNGPYADKNVIIIEESRFDGVQATEKLKNLSTQKEILVNSKNIRQYSIPFYGKLIITSNDETKFSTVDGAEIRYWVRKIPTLQGKANHNILVDVKNEIPQFLYYLNTLPNVDTSKSRMVFDANDIKTIELDAVKKESRSGLCKDLELILDQFMLENTNVREFKFIAKHIKDTFFPRTEKYEISYINKVLKSEMKLPVDKMQRFVPLEENFSLHQKKVSGTPFVLVNKHYKLNIDGTEQQSETITERISSYETEITGTSGEIAY